MKNDKHLVFSARGKFRGGKRCALLLALSAAVCGQSSATPVSANGDVSVEIRSNPLTLSSQTEVNFGTYIMGNEDRNVVLTCDGQKESHDTVSAVQFGDSAICGYIEVSSDAATSYTVDIAATQLSAGNNRSINAPALVVYDADGITPTGNTVQNITRNNTHEYHIGGSLSIPRQQANGTYAGMYTFTATVQ